MKYDATRTPLSICIDKQSNQVEFVLGVRRLRTLVLGLAISVRPTVLDGLLQFDQHLLVFVVQRHRAENVVYYIQNDNHSRYDRVFILAHRNPVM